MNFTDIVSSILSTTKRPDKINDIRREVNAAILFFSTDAEYAQDMQEIQYPLPIAGSEAAINVASVLPRFRSIGYIKISGTKIYATKLETLTPSTCTDLRNKYYLAGTSLNVNLSQRATLLDIGYYAYPPYLTDAAPTYWMLEGNWYAIEQKALSTILNDIGDAQGAQGAERKAVAAYSLFKNSATRG